MIIRRSLCCGRASSVPRWAALHCVAAILWSRLRKTGHLAGHLAPLKAEWSPTPTMTKQVVPEQKKKVIAEGLITRFGHEGGRNLFSDTTQDGRLGRGSCMSCGFRGCSSPSIQQADHRVFVLAHVTTPATNVMGFVLPGGTAATGTTPSRSDRPHVHRRTRRRDVTLSAELVHGSRAGIRPRLVPMSYGRPAPPLTL